MPFRAPATSVAIWFAVHLCTSTDSEILAAETAQAVVETQSERESATGRVGAQEVHRALQLGAQDDGGGLQVHAAGLDLGEVEDVVEQAEQVLGAAPDGGDVFALVFGGGAIFEEGAEADDGV